MTEDELQDEAEKIGVKLMEFAQEHCRETGPADQFNAMLFGVAAGDVIAINFSLLPKEVGGPALSYIINRMVATFNESTEVGAMN